MIRILFKRRAVRRMRELAQTRTSVPVHESKQAQVIGHAILEIVPDARKVEAAMAKLKAAARAAQLVELTCHGCAHSAASAPFPGRPSGERPCGFCVRNPELGESGVADWFGDRGPLWYDGETPPFRTPMDCYIATDRAQQQRIFDVLDEHKRTGKPVPPRERYDRDPFSAEPGEAWCCDGGDGPSGHTWTCWRWLGISFG